MEEHRKITILNLILDNKQLLFGKFDSKVTNDAKIKKWEEITSELQAQGIFTKDWKYLRDTTWQNWRKRTIEKIDNRNKTGSGGGKKFKLNDCDRIILNIVGKESPVIDGLKVPESSGSNQIHYIPATSPSIISVGTGEAEKEQVNSSSRKKEAGKEQANNSFRKKISLDELKAKKLELEILLLKGKLELVEREKKKLDLEIRKLDKELKPTEVMTLNLQDCDMENFFLDPAENLK